MNTMNLQDPLLKSTEVPLFLSYMPCGTFYAHHVDVFSVVHSRFPCDSLGTAHFSIEAGTSTS